MSYPNNWPRHPARKARGVARYLRPTRKELVRIAGIADPFERYGEFQKFWNRNCSAWDEIDPRIGIPRSLRSCGVRRVGTEPEWHRIGNQIIIGWTYYERMRKYFAEKSDGLTAEERDEVVG